MHDSSLHTPAVEQLQQQEEGGGVAGGAGGMGEEKRGGGERGQEGVAQPTCAKVTSQLIVLLPTCTHY